MLVCGAQIYGWPNLPTCISAAISKQPLEKDQAVTVHDLEGLVLKVEPVSESETTNAELQT